MCNRTPKRARHALAWQITALVACCVVLIGDTCNKKLINQPPSGGENCAKPIGSHYPGPNIACSMTYDSPPAKLCVDNDSETYSNKQCGYEKITSTPYACSGHCDGAGHCELVPPPSQLGPPRQIVSAILLDCP